MVVSDRCLVLEIQAKTENWPYMIKRSQVHKLWKELHKEQPFNIFLKIFQRATGYVSQGKLMKRKLFYRDNTLREIAFEIMELANTEHREPIHIVEDELTNIVPTDTRYLLATEILLTMINTNQLLLTKAFTKDHLLTWIKRIAENIPDSIKWKQLYKDRDKICKWFDRLHDLKPYQYSILNILERESEYRVFADLYELDPEIRCIFDKFAHSLGIDDVKNYEQALSKVGLFLADHMDELTEEIEDLKYRMPVRRSKLLPLVLVKQMMEDIPCRFILTSEAVRQLNLGELTYGIVPIFYEDLNGAFRIRLEFTQLNNLLELFMSLPQADERLVDNHKGPIFERLLDDILTGKITILCQTTNRYCGWVTTADKLSLSTAKAQFEQYSIPYKEIKYQYSRPSVVRSPGLIISREENPSFRPLLDEKGKDEWELDIFLIKHDEPKHILVGECIFSRRYARTRYQRRRTKVKKFTNFLRKHPVAKEELSLPLDYPIVATLFTSLSGPIFRQRDGVLKTTFPPILWGTFKNWINQYISTNTLAYP